jgi:hypothetical protein
VIEMKSDVMIAIAMMMMGLDDNHRDVDDRRT